MFKLYSRYCEYALRALVQIPVDNWQKRFDTKDLCAQAQVPEHYTRKAFQLLAKNGLLSSALGPGGGYTLTKNPEQITIIDIIRSIDSDHAFGQCIMGLKECTDLDPCPLHESWKKAKESLKKDMMNKTLSELMRIEFHRVKALNKE